MERKSVIQIVAVLAAALLPVQAIRPLGENHREARRASFSRVPGNHEHTLPTSLRRPLSAATSPAHPRFAHLSVSDGLSHNDVRAIAQDRQGFIWFGTWLGGLNRFDGYTFKVYKHDAKDERALGSDSVRKLFVDREGVLWVAENAGVDRYDPSTDSFIHFKDEATRVPHFFYEDRSGTLWLSSEAGLSRFDRSSGRFSTYRRNANDLTIFGDTNVWPICEDKTTGLLWLGSDEGVTVVVHQKSIRGTSQCDLGRLRRDPRPAHKQGARSGSSARFCVCNPGPPTSKWTHMMAGDPGITAPAFYAAADQM